LGKLNDAMLNLSQQEINSHNDSNFRCLVVFFAFRIDMGLQSIRIFDQCVGQTKSFGKIERCDAKSEPTGNKFAQ